MTEDKPRQDRVLPPDAIQLQSFKNRLAYAATFVGGPIGVARRSGLSRAVIGKYLAGKSQPNRERLVKLADACDVRLDWLASGAGPMKRGGSVNISEHVRTSASGGRWEPDFELPGQFVAEVKGTGPLDASLLMRTAREYFEFLERRRPNWSAERKAFAFVSIYLGLTARGDVDASSIKEAVEMFE